ncbi:unnamed protein product [Linum tenue]|uniref:Uncharacterized protein n=1 Tax=Linum tenue TaxID=586396 RepID=A0AAV0K434_9ROSI|nr:unnamed protein product [Linum tenue]
MERLHLCLCFLKFSFSLPPRSELIVHCCFANLRVFIEIRKQHSFSDSDSDSDRSQAGESNSVLSNSIFKFYFELTAPSVSPSPHDLSKIQSRPRHRHLPFFLRRFLMPCMPGAHPTFRSHLVLRFPPPASTSSTSSASNHGLARPPISPPLAPNGNPWILPHSCGELCNRPLKNNCGHFCLVLSQPGPCPPSVS